MLEIYERLLRQHKTNKDYIRSNIKARLDEFAESTCSYTIPISFSKNGGERYERTVDSIDERGSLEHGQDGQCR
ncbi:hypothetical protein ABES58_03975 [Paenibacillus lautus]|uniref:hypothetical protein n=1 Tax=Paenibacillus lautus TaxID=1401 RepID=UPI003D2D2765